MGRISITGGGAAAGFENAPNVDEFSCGQGCCMLDDVAEDALAFNAGEEFDMEFDKDELPRQVDAGTCALFCDTLRSRSRFSPRLPL